MDFCECVKKMSDDPAKKAPPMTVRYYLLLREHVQSCDVCRKRMDEVLDNAPPEKLEDKFDQN